MTFSRQINWKIIFNIQRKKRQLGAYYWALQGHEIQDNPTNGDEG